MKFSSSACAALLLLHVLMASTANAGLMEHWGGTSMLDVSGPLEGTMCNIEAVENANTYQLHSILTEISDRLFFRLVKVDTMAYCDYDFSSEREDVSLSTSSDAVTVGSASSSSGEEEMCGAPAGADSPFGSPFGVMGDAFSSGDGGDEVAASKGHSQCSIETEGGATPIGLDWTMSKSESIANIGFAEKETSDCTSADADDDTPGESLPSSTVVDIGSTAAKDKDVASVYSLSPDFWLDLCDASNPGRPEFVNLKLNPERNTGYNGSHIWEAIYREVKSMSGNIANGSQSADNSDNEVEQRLETRFLHRLISGVHTSVTVSVMLNYYPPSKRKKARLSGTATSHDDGEAILSKHRISSSAALLSKWTGEKNWVPNAAKFAEQVIAFPDHLSNLHFAFVVVLRALIKAKNLLYKFDYATADASEFDHSATRRLVTRLLDSEYLSVCSPVLSAFNETALFPKNELSSHFMEERQRLAMEFKRTFQRITKLVGCVRCSRCRLHARVTFLGLGTALKVLLSDDQMLPKFLGRDEVVALVNTAHKLSESLVATNYLVELYHEESQDAVSNAARALRMTTGLETASSFELRDNNGTRTASQDIDPSRPKFASRVSNDPKKKDRDESSYAEIFGTERYQMAVAIALVLSAASTGRITEQQEDELLDAIARRDDFVLALASQREMDETRFLRHALRALGSESGHTEKNGLISPRFQSDITRHDLVVVGGGLAGMVAAIAAADANAKVVILDKSARLGGNSARASSGINAVIDSNDENSFREDTLKSCGTSAVPELVEVLVGQSNATVTWLSNRLGLPLEELSQLGGHSRRRTHRPSSGLVGAELTSALAREVKKHSARITVITDAKAEHLITSDGGSVQGVAYKLLRSNSTDVGIRTVYGRAVLLSTGGFGYDRAGLLHEFAPEVQSFPTTLGPHTTGDGIRIGLEVGASLVDMKYVQLHPTGFIDPQEPEEPTKVLCAELMRGVGGMLLDEDGDRFVDELATRKTVSDAMLNHSHISSDLGAWLVLSDEMAQDSGAHMKMYEMKGLFKKMPFHSAVQQIGGSGGITEYIMAASGADPDAEGWPYSRVGRKMYGRVPYFFNSSGEDMMKALNSTDWWVARVRPVVHYTMGGLRIDTNGAVMRPGGINNELLDPTRSSPLDLAQKLESMGHLLGYEPIPGLFAAGEVAGGVHGTNRLGGNSLLECAVFGKRIGEAAAAQAGTSFVATATTDSISSPTADRSSLSSTVMTLTEVARHNTEADCFTVIGDAVYDFSNFATEHPGGAKSIRRNCGKDGTEEFFTVHTASLLPEMDFEPIARVAA